jgi:hypothetical protein
MVPILLPSDENTTNPIRGFCAAWETESTVVVAGGLVEAAVGAPNVNDGVTVPLTTTPIHRILQMDMGTLFLQDTLRQRSMTAAVPVKVAKSEAGPLKRCRTSHLGHDFHP